MERSGIYIISIKSEIELRTHTFLNRCKNIVNAIVRHMLFVSGMQRVFLPARRYASAGYRDRNVSVRPSVCPSVRHAPVLC